MNIGSKPKGEQVENNAKTKMIHELIEAIAETERKILRLAESKKENLVFSEFNESIVSEIDLLKIEMKELTDKLLYPFNDLSRNYNAGYQKQYPRHHNLNNNQNEDKTESQF
jgi:hypothetical protein